jgi:Zn-dependent M28 family amino/carboxypeptidase
LDALARQIDATLKPFSFPIGDVTITLDNRVKSTLTSSQNVLGYVEGSDPQLKDEVVVIGAHLDHLGKRGEYVFNGADDNGSGAVGILSLAHAMALNPGKPKRSVLFALWTGEENGLLGSRFYAQNPFFPLKKTVAYLNLDMISRSWDEKALARMARMMNLDLKGDVAKKIKLDNFLTLSLSADAPDLTAALKQADAYVGIDFHLRESKSGGGGSDHTSFAMNKVPWIFFIAGMREDYHQPGDTVEKVEPLVIERICRLVYAAAFLLADK